MSSGTFLYFPSMTGPFAGVGSPKQENLPQGWQVLKDARAKGGVLFACAFSGS